MTLDEYNSNILANAGNQNISVNPDATSSELGEAYTAELVIPTDPDIGTYNVPVTRTFAGNPLCAVYNLEISFINEITGQILLTWMYPDSCFSSSPPTFQYFLIKRNGVPIGTTTGLIATGFLPNYGTTCYTIVPVTDEGNADSLSATTCIEWYVPELCWSPTTIYNEQWIDTQEEVILTLESCGDGMLDFTFPDYGSGYIIDVEPATGQIPSGETLDITLTYDATGFPVGLHDEWLKIETNDPLHLEDSIFNQMLVYTPAMFFGYVHDCNTGLPLAGVTVTAYGAENYSATTNALGYYELYVDEATYDLYFDLFGFESAFVGGIFGTEGGMTEVSICMVETPNAVGWVFADPNEPDTECLITWESPISCNEIIYDDGEADDYVNWALPGGAVGVHFTPAAYPATVLGGRIYVGDLYFPLGMQFAITIMDDDGVDGLPGTTLDSIWIDINSGGWVDFYDFFSTIIDEGDFYFIWYQGYGLNADSIGVDTDMPTVYRSVVKPPGSGWSISPYQDIMIRAYVCGPNTGSSNSKSNRITLQLPKATGEPFLTRGSQTDLNGTVKGGGYPNIENLNSSRSLVDFTVALISDFDPNLGPSTGTLTSIANTTDLNYLDQSYGSYDEGFYAYAIKANYESNESEWIYSNIVAHLLDNEVTIVVSLCNDGELENSEVALIGHDYPYELFQGITDTNGIVVFDSVIDGSYVLLVSKVGYVNSFGNGFVILNDTTIGIELIQKMYPPQNLYVDPLTSVATWDEPLITQLYLEDFEGSTFPPNGWQATAIDVGWFRTDDASSGGWPVPPGDGFYAAVNDDMLGTGPSNSSMDYLITPQVDLRESDDFQLYFTQFYDGSFGHSVYVEYSYDQGTTWEVIETMSPNSEWNSKIVDLSSISGPNSEPVMVAFHGDDHGDWASGWAVDNVEIKNGLAPVIGYNIFLNIVFLAQTDSGETSYTFEDLTYGLPYEACVRAVYDCGTSDSICTSWESVYLQPPRNLTDEYTYGTDEVMLMWNPPIAETNIPEGLVSFNLYRDSINIANIPYEGQGVDDWITYIDNNLEPNPYEYYVSAEYDLDIFGFPGEFGESAWNGPDVVDVVWGSIIPFFEGWDNGTFSFQNWTFNENSENWAINSQEGEPEPSAEFTWDPLLENDYTSTLTSYPIIVDYLTEGDLFLSFDLQLKDRNSTGDEKMLIEVYDGTSWNLAAEFSNSGKFGFTNNILNITQYATGNAINIRFNATGQNSFDIISWMLDNINVYRVCVPPADLTGEPLWNPSTNEPYIEICWDAQDIPVPVFDDSLIVKKMSEIPFVVNSNSYRSITGFNIYRMEINETEYELYYVVDFVDGQTLYCYNDEYPNIYPYTGYYYQVTASYSSETDMCESTPAMALEIPTDDYVLVYFEGIDDENMAEHITLYPNPAINIVAINSTLPIGHITITNYAGQIVYTNKISSATNVKLNTNSYQQGVYLISVKTEMGVATKRLIIKR